MRALTYGGKHVAKGDTLFAFASENEGGLVSACQRRFTAKLQTPSRGSRSHPLVLEKSPPQSHRLRELDPG